MKIRKYDEQFFLELIQAEYKNGQIAMFNQIWDVACKENIAKEDMDANKALEIGILVLRELNKIRNELIEQSKL